MELRKLIESVNMSSSPGYFAGRGPNSGDLDAETLNRIADLIKKHFGDVAHDNFVVMVWKIEVLSASAFLNNLYALQRCDWDCSLITIDENDQGIDSHDQSWGMIATVLSRGASDGSRDKRDSEYIRLGFRRPK